MTEDFCECEQCGYTYAITNYSSNGCIDWVACPRCYSMFDHGKFEGLIEDENMLLHIKKISPEEEIRGE